MLDSLLEIYAIFTEYVKWYRFLMASFYMIWI